VIHPWNASIWQSVLAGVDRLPHALLISGPAGVGKLALARHLARRILCETAQGAADACGNCEGCHWYETGAHPDFRMIQPEALGVAAEDADPTEEPDRPAGTKKGKPSAEIRIEQIRSLADFLNIGSHRARRRIAIVHPAENLNANAANALLKSLEEPPAGALFVLVSHQPSRLLPTVRSRCISLEVPPPDATLAAAWLAEQGVAHAEALLHFHSGAPLRAAEASGMTTAAAVAGFLKSWRERPLAALGQLKEKEELALLVEGLQKYAVDQAFRLSGMPARFLSYRNERTTDPSAALRWARVSRELGGIRRRLDHPLNATLQLHRIMQLLDRL